MKKIFALFFSFALLTACSNNDDVNTSEDPILGKWFIVKVNNSGDLNIVITQCNSTSFISFTDDGKSLSEFYSENNATCDLESSENATWKNEGESKYTIVLPFEGLGSQKGSVEFTGETGLTFFPDIFAAQNTNIVFEKR